MEPESLLLLLNGVALGAVFLASIPAVRAIIDRCSPGRSRSDYDPVYGIYCDQDGSATEESVRSFTDKPQRWLVAILSIIGFFISLTMGVVLTLSEGSDGVIVGHWLQFAIWVCLSVQTAALFAEVLPTKRFTLGICNSGSCIVLIAALALQHIYVRDSAGHSPLRFTHSQFSLAQAVVALLSAIISTLLPRRPDVFRNGNPVDRQFTTSFLSRVTFYWAQSLLGYARKNQKLEINDLDELDYATRSKTLRESFDRTRKPGQKLWKSLIHEYSYSLLIQYTMVLFNTTLSFAPHLCLLGILRALEVRDSESSEATQVWPWVAALGASIVVYSTIDAWQFWIVYYKLGIPVYEQISAAVFAKSMRRKDVKGSQKSAVAKDDEEPSEQPNSSNNDDEDEDAQKTRQATINLVAVDAKRVSDFATYNYIILGTFLKLAIAFTFLIRLIGWKSLCSGLLISLVITPVNTFASKKYIGTQTSLMKYRDQKMAVVTEVLQGIRQIKFSALEDQWEQRIWAIRQTELEAQWTAFAYDIGLISMWIIGPVMLSAISLGVYSLLYGRLSPSVAFTTMSVFSSIEFALAILPELITDFIEAYVSAARIEKHLEAPENVQQTTPADAISFEKATVAWPTEDLDDADDQERFTLQNLNLNFPPKSLSVISGRTGAGKSLLLSSILGEADILQGTVKVPVPPPLEERFDDRATNANWIIDSAIAYVSQIPWIENASIKDNILFGLPLDHERYEKVIFACALKKDFEMLPDGELTDIGANGINLSGGQKWRVSFARALYSRAGILVMDDIFSALDAHTGRHLHVHAITGDLCQGRTRVLVTHHVGLCLGQADYFVHLDNGVVQQEGSVEELKNSGALTSLLEKERETEEPKDEQSLEHYNEQVLSREDEDEDSNMLQKILSRRSQRSNNEREIDGRPDLKKQPQKFQQDEHREIGSIKLSHYINYLRNGGSWFYWLCVFLPFFGYTALSLGRTWWVNVWTRKSTAAVSDQDLEMMFHVSKTAEAPAQEHTTWFYLGIYVLLSVASCIVGTLRYALILRAAIRSSRNLFKKLTFAVLRAPLRWLDTVPVGRILNRFTADFNMIDSKLPYDLGQVVYNALEVVGIIVAGILVSPILILFALVLLGICLYFSQLFLDGAREIKRLESNAKSPVFEQFGSALTGLSTIRAYGKTQAYVERMYAKIDRHCQAYWYLWLFNRWLSFRVDMVGAVFATSTAAIIVYIRGVDASLAGFALSFALQYNDAITWALRQYANVELAMNATERVIEYSDIEVENQGGNNVPAAWPTQGRLEVSDLVVGYAPDLPPVLRGLSFSVQPNQRVGVVGRTGAGKSSLTLALFRFLEAREGSIHIDGIDISRIQLRDLRSRLAIIPQDPVLFSGTIRSNLDAFDDYSDEELRDALERVHLVSNPGTSSGVAPQSGTTTPTVQSSSSTTATNNNTANTNIFNSLTSTISEGGLNLSQGQRQLLCLARAIVSRPKIMVLDEATSAVDMDTDALIQHSIRSEFGRNSTTLLVIAHRLSTIADFDRILVMDAGRAVEFGRPKELLGIEDGVFRGLVQESGERDELEKVILGQ